MEYLIAWVLFGFATAVMAKGKGRNKFLWFFIGLLLGPFAVLIVALLPAGPKADQGYN